MTSAIMSRPVYQPFRMDPRGRHHLIVAECAALPAHLHLGTVPAETWLIGTSAPGIAVEPGGNNHGFRSTTDLLTHLRHRLGRETIGLRLYAIGTEAFLWDVMNIAQHAGLSDDEVCLTHEGSLRRRVYCIHCKTTTDNVTSNIVDCAGCGARLFVRDHFSRRLAAFMGVMVDAEVPGAVPPIEAIYP
jgi:hypothetical protein